MLKAKKNMAGFDIVVILVICFCCILTLKVEAQSQSVRLAPTEGNLPLFFFFLFFLWILFKLVYFGRGTISALLFLLLHSCKIGQIKRKSWDRKKKKKKRSAEGENGSLEIIFPFCSCSSRYSFYLFKLDYVQVGDTKNLSFEPSLFS